MKVNENFQVIGLVDNQERGELVRERGAFETLAFSDKLEKKCMKITDNKGVHVVYDAVGDLMFEPIQAWYVKIINKSCILPCENHTSISCFQKQFANMLNT